MWLEQSPFRCKKLLILMVFSTVTHFGEAACSCPSSMSKLPSGKFPQYCYYVTINPYTGTDCANTCQNLGDHVVTWVPLNAEESGAVFEWLMSTSALYNAQAWIGIRDDLGVTMTGTSWSAATHWSNWNPGQPDSTVANCVWLENDFNVNGRTWNDAQCGIWTKKCMCRSVCADQAVSTQLLPAIADQNKCFSYTTAETDYTGVASTCTAEYPGSVPAPIRNDDDFIYFREYAISVQKQMWSGFNDEDNDAIWTNVDGTPNTWSSVSSKIIGFTNSECGSIRGDDTSKTQLESKRCGETKIVLCMFDCPCASNPCQNGGTCTMNTGVGWKCGCAVGYTGNDCATIANVNTGWVQDSSSGDCYAITPLYDSMFDVARYCQNVGSNIASLHNLADRTAVWSFLTPFGVTWAWMGVNDITLEGSYKNMDATAYDYNGFKAGEPNNAGNEDCSNIVSDGLNDLPCYLANAQAPGVCMITPFDSCASNPCQNGGTCTLTNCGLTRSCTCHSPFTGELCEVESGTAVLTRCYQSGAAVAPSVCYAQNAISGRGAISIGDRCIVLIKTSTTKATGKSLCASTYTDGHLAWLDQAFYKTRFQQLAMAVYGWTPVVPVGSYWRLGLAQYDTSTSSEPAGSWGWYDQNDVYQCDFTGHADWAAGKPDNAGGVEHDGIIKDTNLEYDDVAESLGSHTVCQFKITQDSANDQCASSPCQNTGSCVDGLNAFWCKCPAGTSGPLCEINVDECASTPCQNSGLCVDGINQYTCVCPTAWTSTHCETDTDECQSNPCQNGAPCSNLYDRFTCACTPGWTNANCGTSINECASTPCGSTGTCYDGHLSYSCVCNGGYTDTNCQTDINECSSQPCNYCLPCNDMVNAYQCDCTGSGYIGSRCQTLVNPCSPNPCQNGGVCSGGRTIYVCACPNGYTGTNCETVQNSCTSNPCQNGGNCVAGTNSYSCTCLPNTSGSKCEYVNVCATANPCVHGTCSWEHQGENYLCTCYWGWMGRNCDYDNAVVDTANPRCSDRQNYECLSPDPALTYERCLAAVRLLDDNTWTGGQFALEGKDNCCYRPANTWGSMYKSDKSGECNDPCAGNVNTTCGVTTQCSNSWPKTCANDGICYDIPSPLPQTTGCVCKSPWSGSTCATDPNECLSTPCMNGGTCYDFVGYFTCGCQWWLGYTGDLCEKFNDCASNPCQNAGTCLDMGLSYTCLCPFEWAGDNCESANDCMCNNCTNGATCIDGINTFSCSCVLGFTGHYCEIEIDECDSTPCREDSTCSDFLAYYECTCQAGFTSTNCEINIDDCPSNPCVHGTCYDGVVLYWCVCAPGYTGYNCEFDINECESGPCHPSATCLDLVARFYCFCTPGYTAYECNIDIDECISNPCVHGATCVDHVNYYTCVCVPGYSAYDCEEDINECISDPCQNGGACDDRVNHYMCTCAVGYTSVDCEIEVDECQSITCWNGGSCNDFIGWYNCTCLAGFTDFHCETDIDECASNPCIHFDVCYEGVDLWWCDCTLGYTGGTCNIDIDECASDPCVNGTCWDRIGFYECECEAGYTGYDCETDIDECWSTPCQYDGTCTDMLAGYMCNCIAGITGLDCEINIDECASTPCNRMDNNATCNDLINGYNCTCLPEWTETHCDLETKIWEILQLFKAGALSDLSALRDVVAQSSLIVDSVPFIVATLPEESRWPLSWTTNDSIAWCTFNGKSCDIANDFKAKIDPVMGTCFTFNDDSIARYKVSRAGMGQGLLMYLKAGQAEYTPWVDVAGFRLYIHNQSEQVYAESVSYSVNPGYSTIISLKWKEFKRLGGQYGRCINDPSEVKAFYYSGSYSADGCLRSCYQIEVNEVCKCMDPRFPVPKDAKICGLNERKCVNNFIDTNGDPNKWQNCNLNDCPLPCYNGEYDVTVSRTRFRTDPPSCKNSNPNVTQACRNEIANEVTKVELYIEDLSFIVLQETVRYPFTRMLSDVGGQLGILCGMSVFSIMEILFTFTQVGVVLITGKGY